MRCDCEGAQVGVGALRLDVSDRVTVWVSDVSVGEQSPQI